MRLAGARNALVRTAKAKIGTPLALGIFSRSITYPAHKEAHTHSITNPAEFWREQAANVPWFKAPTNILDRSDPIYTRWFTDGTMNMSYAALDANIAKGRGNQIAIIHDNAYEGKVTQFTFNEVLKQVEQVAGSLVAQGVKKGDRVLIYMPMIPEAAFSMLACARIGAVHSVVFGGFASAELRKRVDAAEPVVILTASCGLEPKGKIIDYKHLVDAALAEAKHKVRTVVVKQREAHTIPTTEFVKGRDITWDEFCSKGTPVTTPVELKATDSSYVLYTSGTTGQPKGVVRDIGGQAVALTYSMKHIFGVNPGETWFAASDIGWVVGHSYIVYGPLLNGNTTIMFEGKPVMTPDASTYWRLMSQHKVSACFTAPTALRAIKKEDPELKHLIPYRSQLTQHLRTLFVAGERADPYTVTWATNGIGVPVIDHYWQTETGWPVIGPASPVKDWKLCVGSAGVPIAGYDVRLLDDEGKPVTKPETSGNIVIKLPLPPGTLASLYNAPERYVKSYLERFPGYYDTSDAGFYDEHGRFFVMTRTDDVMNVAGHRLSSGAIEEVVAQHESVAECAVVAMPDALKGSMPLVFAVLKEGAKVADPVQVEKQVIHRVREGVGHVASPRRVLCVNRLPKTRSGKILRATLRQILKYVEDSSAASADPSAAAPAPFEKAVPVRIFFSVDSLLYQYCILFNTSAV